MISISPPPVAGGSHTMMKIRTVLVPPMVVASAMGGGCVACGEQVGVAEGPEAGLNRDGAPFDRESDHTMGGEASPRPDVAASDGGYGESEYFDAFFPFPADAKALDSGCHPYVCNVGELCVTQVILPSSQVVNTWCVDVPQGCGEAPPSMCMCLEQSSISWCVQHTCMVDGGQIVLTCIDVPPP
jgi:hypothetical protein